MRLVQLVLLLCLLVGPARADVTNTVALSAGWNVVAFPCGSLTAVNGSSAVAGVAVFDGTAYSVRPLTVAELNAGDGTRRAFWFFCTGPGSLTWSGTELPGDGLRLRRGWNLVSFPLPGATLTAGSLTVRRSGLPSTLAQLLLPQFYEISTGGQYTVVDVGAGALLRPGRGYWILFCLDDGVTLSYGGTDPLILTAAIGQAAATAAVGGLTTTLTDNPASPTLDTTRPGALAQSALLLGASLAAGGSGTVAGERGGQAVVVANSSPVTITFNNFKTANATLNGTLSASLTGGLVVGSFTANATFTAFRVAVDNGPTYQFEGSANLARTRSLTPGPAASTLVNGTFTANFTAADASGPYVRYENFVVATNTSLLASNGSFNGTQAYNGTVAFQNYQGTTGRVAVTTPTALAFSGTTGSFQLTAGQVILTATGALRLTLVSPNQVEVAVQLPGTSAFAVVGTFSWAALGGLTSS